jgi:GNAT superfamily N-acetyltransferase
VRSGTLSIPRGDLIGPAFVGYTDADKYRPIPGGPTRPLRLEDRPAVQGLRESCDRTEWSHGGSDLQADHPSIGIFEGDRLVTLAGYKLWAGRIAHISIIAHPACRGRGHAAAAVAELTRLVLASGLVRQYRTLESNCPSMAIAAALGFERYATTVWCRIGNVSD